MFNWLRKLFGGSTGHRRRRRSSRESQHSEQPIPIRPRQQITPRSKPAAQQVQESGNPFHGLRSQAFSITRTEVGIPPLEKASTPWGVIMEMGYDGATVTLVAFAEGTASIYLSSGGGFIGGGEHQTIRNAAQAFVAAADEFKPQMIATTDFPEPRRGQTIFYLRTDDGVFTAAASEKELGERRHPLAPLFHAAQEVITQYRLIDQTPK